MFSCIIFTLSSERNKWATWTQMSTACGPMSAYGVTWVALYGRGHTIQLVSVRLSSMAVHHSLPLGIWWDVIYPGDRENHESGTICVVARKKITFLTFPLQVEMQNLCPWFLYRYHITLTCVWMSSNECGTWVLGLSLEQVRDGPPEFGPGKWKVKY